MDSPRKESSITNGVVYVWSLNSIEKRHGNPLWGFDVYSEARLIAAKNEKDALPPIDFHLPADDLPDGTPAQQVYFMETDGRVRAIHEKTWWSDDGSWQDSIFIEEEYLTEGKMNLLLERIRCLTAETD